MDIEGLEYEVLKESIDFLETFKSLKLCLELHGHIIGREKAIDLLCSLKKVGFNLLGAFRDVEFWFNCIPPRLKGPAVKNWEKINQIPTGRLPYGTLENIVDEFRTTKPPFCFGMILEKKG
jgi:hypothetical protein